MWIWQSQLNIHSGAGNAFCSMIYQLSLRVGDQTSCGASQVIVPGHSGYESVMGLISLILFGRK